MEPVWRYLKSHYLADRIYRDHQALWQAGCDAWNHFTDNPERVRFVSRYLSGLFGKLIMGVVAFVPTGLLESACGRCSQH